MTPKTFSLPKGVDGKDEIVIMPGADTPSGKYTITARCAADDSQKKSDAEKSINPDAEKSIEIIVDGIDLRIDSNNNGTIDDEDDVIEDVEDKPGKVIPVNIYEDENQKDENQKDENQKDKNKNLALAEMKIILPAQYVEKSSSYFIQFEFGENLRVWKTNTIKRASDDCLKSGEKLNLSDFTWKDQPQKDQPGTKNQIKKKEATLYVEAIKDKTSKKSGADTILCNFLNSDVQISCDLVRVTATKFVLESITSETQSNLIVKNPCGIPKDGKATFFYKTKPEDLNAKDAGIKWIVKEGNITIKEGDETEKEITVQATGVGNFKLTVDVKLEDDNNPQIRGEVLELKNVPVFFWVVRNGPKDPARTEEIITDKIDKMIDQVNLIYQQVAMKFKTESIKYIDDPEFLVIDEEKKEDELVRMNSGTKGLEVYIVEKFSYRNKWGVNIETTGIILSEVAYKYPNLFAHEIGHACGLEDIYIKGVCNDAKKETKKDWQKEDWTGGPDKNGYYATTHKDLIEKLVMNGLMDPTATTGNLDISVGIVNGGKKEDGSSCADLKTGLSSMNRQPEHNNALSPDQRKKADEEWQKKKKEWQKNYKDYKEQLEANKKNKQKESAGGKK